MRANLLDVFNERDPLYPQALLQTEDPPLLLFAWLSTPFTVLGRDA